MFLTWCRKKVIAVRKRPQNLRNVFAMDEKKSLVDAKCSRYGCEKEVSWYEKDHRICETFAPWMVE